MEFIIPATIALGVIFLTIIIAIAFNKKQLARTFESAQAESKTILEEARVEADKLVKAALRDAKEESRRRRQSFEDETKNRRADITKMENKLKAREQNLEKKLAIIEKREQEIDRVTQAASQEEQRYKRLIGECEKTLEHNRRTLQNIARLTAEEAKRELIKTMEDDARKDAQERLRRIEEETKQQAETIARSMVSLSVQRLASEHVNDSSITVVALPSEDMKGRIIGREGRNIRAIEAATGVDLIIDDTPEAVIISCFNPIRREIAKIAIERLVADGRIHPARISETVKRIEGEFNQIMQENGEQACFETGITDMHPELVKRLGRLRYRTTGQQSVLQHAVEVAHICGIMAGEMNLNVKIAKRAGLLHDIGKSVDHETEGHHSNIGADLCSQYQEAEPIIEAVRSHHAEDISRGSPYAVIVHAANMLSSNRPGARKELLESYVKRLEDMETIIRGFNGIESAYVLQAGREVRAMVTPTGISDEEITGLSSDIAFKLRKELSFPGQVRVTVVRESKFAEMAK